MLWSRATSVREGTQSQSLQSVRDCAVMLLLFFARHVFTRACLTAPRSQLARRLRSQELKRLDDSEGVAVFSIDFEAIDRKEQLMKWLTESWGPAVRSALAYLVVVVRLPRSLVSFACAWYFSGTHYKAPLFYHDRTH